MINAVSSAPPSQNNGGNDEKPASFPAAGSLPENETPVSPVEPVSSPASSIPSRPTAPISPITEPSPFEPAKVSPTADALTQKLNTPIGDVPFNSNPSQDATPPAPPMPPAILPGEGLTIDPSDNSGGGNKKKSGGKGLSAKMIVGAVLLFLLVIGSGAGLYLSQQSQDIRQSADTAGCDNGVAIGETACQNQGDPVQYRCGEGSTPGNNNWIEESCGGGTCQGSSCTTASTGDICDQCVGSCGETGCSTDCGPNVNPQDTCQIWSAAFMCEASTAWDTGCNENNCIKDSSGSCVTPITDYSNPGSWCKKFQFDSNAPNNAASVVYVGDNGVVCQEGTGCDRDALDMDCSTAPPETASRQYTLTTQLICPDGSSPTAIAKRMYWTMWPPGEIVWVPRPLGYLPGATGNSITANINVASFDPANNTNVYVAMAKAEYGTSWSGWSAKAFKAINLPSGFLGGTYFNPLTEMVKFPMNTTPSGSYTLQYQAPPELCEAPALQCNSSCTASPNGDPCTAQLGSAFSCISGSCRLTSNPSSTTCTPPPPPTETLQCNSSCSTNLLNPGVDKCATDLGSAYSCIDNRCRLTANPSSTTCQEVQPVACNSICTSDQQCQLTNSSYTCQSVGDGISRCRHQSYPDQLNCEAPAPMCLAISMSPTAPAINDTVTFTCAQVAGVSNYGFRVIQPNGTISDLSSQGNVSSPYTIAQSGTYRAECRLCTTPNCEEWPSDGTGALSCQQNSDCSGALTCANDIAPSCVENSCVCGAPGQSPNETPTPTPTAQLGGACNLSSECGTINCGTEAFPTCTDNICACQNYLASPIEPTPTPAPQVGDACTQHSSCSSISCSSGTSPVCSNGVCQCVVALSPGGSCLSNSSCSNVVCSNNNASVCSEGVCVCN